MVQKMIEMQAKLSIGEQMEQLYQLFGYEDQIIWDQYRECDIPLLKTKLETLISNVENATPAQNKKMNKVRSEIFNAIWNQRKFNQHHHLLMYPSFVGVVPIKEYRNLGMKSMEYFLYPVFRIRRCISNTEEDELNEGSRGCCMIYVDLSARVYNNWEQFKENNKLPKGYIIAPKDGVFTKYKGKVELVTFLSPASKGSAKALEAADIGVSVVGLAGSGLLVTASAVTAVAAAPVVVPIATACVVSTGVYGAVRSICTLVDRGQHQQSNGLDNSEARSSIICAAGSIAATAAGAATNGLAIISRATGSASALATVVVNGINLSAISINGLGILNGGYTFAVKLHRSEKISALDFIHFSASLALFTHSIYNFRTAASIVEEGREGFLKDFVNGLTKQQQDGFNRLYKTMMEYHGSEKQAQRDLIRQMGDTPTSRQAFADLHAIETQFARINVKGTSITPEGVDVSLDYEVLSDSTNVSQNLASAKTLVETDTSNNDKNLLCQRNEEQSAGPLIFNIINFTANLAGVIAKIKPCFRGEKVNMDNLKEAVSGVLMQLKTHAFDKFINFIQNFAIEMGKAIELKLGVKLGLEFYIRNAFAEFYRMSNGNINDFIENLDLEEAQKFLQTYFTNPENFNGLDKEKKNVILSSKERKCKECFGIYYTP